MFVYNNSLWKTRQTNKQSRTVVQTKCEITPVANTKKSKWQCDAALRRAAAQLFYVIERVRKPLSNIILRFTALETEFFLLHNSFN